ncbi:MAG: alpha/beta hydrolase [Desulfarculaceae bacterium]
MPAHTKPNPYLPFPPGLHSRWLTFPWGKMHMALGGQGPPLALIHGLGGSCEDFFYSAPFLMPQRLLLIPDLPGFGRSDKPDSSYSMDWMLKQIEEFASSMELKGLEWLGHSMGGLLVLWLAVLHPQLVSRLIAVCPAGGHVHTSWLYRALYTFLVTKEDTLRYWRPCFNDWAIKRIFSDPSKPAAQELKQRLSAQRAGPDHLLRERALIRAGRGVLRRQIWNEVGEIQAPVLMVIGAKDKVVPAPQTRRLFAHLPANKKMVSLDCGHMPPYSKPKELSRAVLAFITAGR